MRNYADSGVRQVEPVRNLVVRDYVNVTGPGEISRDAAQAISAAKCYNFSLPNDAHSRTSARLVP